MRDVSDVIKATQEAAEVVASLVLQAELGHLPWEVVAMHEKAHIGLVTYATYKQMTPSERAKVGAMNQSTVRRRLGFDKEIP